MNSSVRTDCEGNISDSYEEDIKCVYDDGGSDLGHILVVCLIYGPIVLVTILGNLLVITAFFRDPTIRCRVVNCYILSLACADFIMGFNMSLNFVWLITDDWILGKIPCLVLLCVDYTAAYASVLSIILISYDRYRMITLKLKYLVVQARRRAVLSICGCWAFCLIFYPAYIVLWAPITGEQIIDYNIDCHLQSMENLFANVFLIFIEFILPLNILVYFNITLYVNLRRRAKGLARGEGSSVATVSSRLPKSFTQRRPRFDVSKRGVDSSTDNSTGVVSLSSVNVTTDRDNSERNAATFSDAVSSLQGKSTYGTSFLRHRQFHKNRKAAANLSLLVGVYVMCWLPYYIKTISQIFCEDCINYYIVEVMDNLLYCNSTLNPFLYALLNRRFRRYFVHVFRRVCCMKTKPRPWLKTRGGK